MTVATGTGAVLITRVRPPGERAKITAGEFASNAGLAPGSKLGD